jgi:hypothetical protein
MGCITNNDHRIAEVVWFTLDADERKMGILGKRSLKFVRWNEPRDTWKVGLEESRY